MKTLNWKSTVMWTALSLLFLLLALMVGPTPALAADATLYELTENMKLVGGKVLHRNATSELMGTANLGTPLCPAWVAAVSPGTTRCTINATGSDNISLVTGRGDFSGTYTVVIQGDNQTDSPEYVVAKGKFRGKMDFSPAILGGMPYGTVVGTLDPDGGGRGDRARFTGMFFLPFTLPPDFDPSGTPCYLDFTYGVVPVADNQKALGYPTVKFEISFE